MIMNTKQRVTRISLTIFAMIALAALSMSLTAAPKMKPKPVVIQTNYAADFISIIDPNTNKVIGEISGIELNHGVAIAPDGSKIYISDENNESLDFVDAKPFRSPNAFRLPGTRIMSRFRAMERRSMWRSRAKKPVWTLSIPPPRR